MDLKDEIFIFFSIRFLNFSNAVKSLFQLNNFIVGSQKRKEEANKKFNHLSETYFHHLLKNILIDIEEFNNFFKKRNQKFVEYRDQKRMTIC
jgi:hypothetical protein